MDNDNAEEASNTYALVHVLPLKTGGSYKREIISTEAIRKFNFEIYKNNKDAYKTKKFKLQFGPERNIHKCYVLFAADNYNKVYETSLKKRFSIPTLSDTISLGDSNNEILDTHNDVLNNEHSEILEGNGPDSIIHAAKKRRKTNSQTKKQNKEARDNEILQKYLNTTPQVLEEDEILDSINETINPRTSTPLRDLQNINNINEIVNPRILTPLRDQNIEKYKDNTIRKQAIQIRRLNHQLKAARKEIFQINKEHAENLNQERNIQSSKDSHENSAAQTSSYKPHISIDPFKVHDKIYGFNAEQAEEELQFDADGNIHIGFNVYCNPTSYFDSFKGKNPYTCLYLLSQGLYKLEDLANRCVRKQKNTLHKKLLSPMKSMAIERKVYTFMRIKDKTISQVDDFLNDINNAHHQAIYSAKQKIVSQEKLRERERLMDQEREIN